MNNIILTGFMGTGKTEVGVILAKMLKCPFVDVDALIEEMSGKKIPDIFAQEGEDYFRSLEAKAIKKAIEGEGKVISTGGGALIKKGNRENLNKGGTLICLTASPEEILKRTGSREGRPLLQRKDPLQKIKVLLAERKIYYDALPLQVSTDGKTPEKVAAEIISKIF